MNRIDKYHPEAERSIREFHPSVVNEIQQAITENEVVVVGMFLNPYVLFVRLALKQANIPYRYLQYGGYLSKWKHRLSIKIWSGWPTFPQVFVNGHLVGGNKKTRQALKDGSFQALRQNKPEAMSPKL